MYGVTTVTTAVPILVLDHLLPPQFGGSTAKVAGQSTYCSN